VQVFGEVTLLCEAAEVACSTGGIAGYTGIKNSVARSALGLRDIEELKEHT
jgi:hypothetical protein